MCTSIARAAIAAAAVCSTFAALHTHAAPVSMFVPPGVRLTINDLGQSSVVAQIVPGPILRELKPSVDQSLRELNDRIRDEARKFFLTVDADIKLLEWRFEQYVNHGRELVFYADIDTAIMRCEVRAKLMLTGPLASARPKDTGSKADCRAGGFIAKQMVPWVEARAVEAIRDGINKSKLVSPDTLKEWMALDPEWGAFVQQANLEAYYCDTATKEQGVCVSARWPQPDAFKKWADSLVARAPKPGSAADKALAKAQLEAYLTKATDKAAGNLKPSTRVPGLEYPAERRPNGTFNDFDMALFGGLLCAAGELRGCALVANSQGEDGRFWRSPDRVGILPNPKDDESTFSGDAFNGAVAYFVASKPDDENKKRFAKYLGYLANHQQTLFGSTFHKSCMDDQAFQCAIGGGEWYWMNHLAKKFGAEATVPPTMRDPATVYGFTPDTIRWQALLVPAGYRLHLTAIQVWMHQKAGLNNPVVRETAAILAGRQPDNAFHRYLHLGADVLVQQATQQACDPNRAQGEYTDWTWQRATADKAWERSMRWDCVFMWQLLAS